VLAARRDELVVLWFCEPSADDHEVNEWREVSSVLRITLPPLSSVLSR
jgi:hypothetical protein